MVWPAVLLMLVLVLGRGEAHSMFCDEATARMMAAGDIAEVRRRGFFVAPATPTRVFLRILLNETPFNKAYEGYSSHDCFLQHEDGPLSLVAGAMVADSAEFAGRCHDPVSGRDHVILSTYSGGARGLNHLEYWSVQPDTQQLTLEYEQGTLIGAAAFESDLQPLVGADGQCLWRPQKRARDVFKDAIAALGVGVELEEKALDIEVGATLTLPTRTLTDDIVRHWLHALHTHAPTLVTFETARSSGAPHPQPWRILQILGQQKCGAPGVVLLQDTRSGQWHSIYDVPSGCTYSLNFPLGAMRITGDTLSAKFCTDCLFWGQYGTFTLDLPTNRLTRLEGAEVSGGANMPVTDPLAFVDQEGRTTPSAADAAQ